MNEDPKDPKPPVTDPIRKDAEVKADEQPKRGTPDEVAQGIIDDWLAAMRNSPLSRHTVSFNYIQSKLPVLKSLIAKEITK